MDLVDIDKVLDDLELSEGNVSTEINCSSTVFMTTSDATATRCNVNNSKSLDCSSDFTSEFDGSSQKNQQKSLAKSIASSNQDCHIKSINDERAKNRKFVTVSNVFSSLEDYRRDVESLQENNDVFIKQVSSVLAEGAQSEQNDTKSELESNECVNIEANDSAEKQNEDDEITENEPEEAACTNSTSSITTSSPSSFSSGPSPGSLSESCSYVLGQNQEINNQLAKLEDNNILKNEGPDDEVKNVGNNPKLEFKHKSKDGINSIIQQENEGNKESLELGLSSISSYLYCENVSSSLPGSSQDMKFEALSSISSQTQNFDKEFGADDTNMENSKLSDYDNERPLDQLHKSSPKQKIVGFGSTMDEISDTELDSILQEIDNDFQMYYTPPNNSVERPVSTSMSKAKLPKSNILEDDSLVANDEKPSKFLKSEGDLSGNGFQNCPQASMEDENNLQNADSFSQASTIEFADLRLQTDFDLEINDEKSVNATSNTISDQTVESASAALENDFGLKSQSDKSTKIKEKPNENVESKRSNSLEQQERATHLQRPNSLDLPTQMDIKLYINSTAGQTPPASRLDDISLLSTSSSDDQQIPSEFAASNSAQSNWPDRAQKLDTNFECSVSNNKLGKVPPFWIPDSEAPACMQCKQKFSLIKRRHHCRACGQVLCSVCCSQKAKLMFLGYAEVRVCVQCSLILNERKSNEGDKIPSESASATGSSNILSENEINSGNGLVAAHRSPNPNNPMEYCSVISPYQQVVQQAASSPISVMVPVGVLKREGAPKNTRKDKNVIFSDGIRPGCDLTELDNSWGNDNKVGKVDSTVSGNLSGRKQASKATQRTNRNVKSPIYDETESYIPKEVNSLPPVCVSTKTEFEYKEVQNNVQLIDRLQNETLKFIIQRNFFVYVKIVKLKCCVNKTIINFTTQGMHHVGQDEIIILLEMDGSDKLPKDVFVHLNEIYKDADHGYPVSELGFSMPKEPNFLGSREHGGFLYIRSTFQCLQEVHLPESPFLIGLLIHRWEVPWAKIFPLRLMLRLGAEYRYYPSPHISIRGRNSVYAEIAQTIINFLADFRNYSYTLATIRGMYVHMEDRRTNILIPKNRYDQVIKALNNSSDHILALGANFSKKADGHLVCIQNMDADCPETHTYSTQAINIQGQARKVTGASFIVFNGALKTTSGLTGKCNIVEDGLMVQILPAKMQSVRTALKNMKDIEIVCGPVDVDELQTEIVSIKWTANDTEFNIGVKSPIDGKRMDGIPSIRVHSGLNYSNKNHVIRWTEVFVIQYDEESVRNKDPIDISKISEQIAKSTSIALVSLLDLLAANECFKIGLRATLHHENVCYEAGSKNSKLPPLYMNALDNELIPILHKQTTTLDIDTPVILELIFNILNK